MSDNWALTIGYSVAAIVVPGSFYLFGWWGLGSLIALLVVDQIHYRLKHGYWQKSTYVD